MRVEETADLRILTANGRFVRNRGVYPVNKDSAAENPAEHDGMKTDPAYKNDILEKIIDDLNKKLNGAGRELRCSIHRKTGQVMVKVVDTESGKTIREIPPEKSLDILAKILEQSGLLVDEKT